MITMTKAWLVFGVLLHICFGAGASAQVRFDDAFVQGGMVRGAVGAGDQLFLDGKPVQVGSDGRFVFGFHRDHEGPATVRLLRADGIEQVFTVQVTKRQFDIQRINGLPPKSVTPPPEWAARRKVETGRVRKARALTSAATDWQAGFLMPTKGRISGVYGSQRILNGKPRSPHYGIDIAAPDGTPVIAPAGGVITLAAPDFLLEGGIVIIDHGFGLSSTLFHLSSVDVKEGERVPQGAQIGAVGSTGRSTGPHVDWRINWGNVRLDPALVLPPEDQPEATRRSFETRDTQD